jgi:hypothetical protein
LFIPPPALYVDHHDEAYDWAERRRIEAHPKTGAIQIVGVGERVDEVRPDQPQVARHAAAAEESAAVGAWVASAIADGLAPSEIGLFVRCHEQIDRARRDRGSRTRYDMMPE